MRRAQSVRHYARPSLGNLALAGDELGVLREGDETNEDVLRRQLLEKDRENDRVSGMPPMPHVARPQKLLTSSRLQLQTQMQSLQAQLSQRPPLEEVQQMEKEYRNLELLWQGTQRENERCMSELER